MKLLVYAFPCQTIKMRVVENYDPAGECANCQEVYATSFGAISSFAATAREVNSKFADIDETIIFGPYDYAAKFKEFLLEDFPGSSVRIVSPKKGM